MGFKTNLLRVMAIGKGKLVWKLRWGIGLKDPNEFTFPISRKMQGNKSCKTN